MELQPGSEAHRKYYARFARIAYDYPSMREKTDVPEGFVIDPRYSNRNRVLLRNDTTREAVYAFRGTDIKNKADLATDVALAAGYQGVTSRFRNATKYTRAARADLPGYKLTLTGHSLGSSSAAYAHGRIKDTDYVGFSPHVPTKQIGTEFARGIMDRVKPSRQRSVTYSVIGDPVAFGDQLSFKKNTFTVPQTSGSPHDLTNFE